MSQELIDSYSSSVCPLCNKQTNIITDLVSGETVCTNCGSVITDKAQETRAEWNAFDTGDANLKSRTGAPTSLSKYDRGLSTVIGKINRDASGQQFDAMMRNRIDRWRTWDTRSQTHDSTKRNLQAAFMQLYTMKDVLGLPDSAIEKIAYLYRKIQEKGLVKGRTIKGGIAVASYIACREMGIPRTLKEIANITNLKEREITRVYRKVIVELDLKIPQDDPIKKIIKIANKCGISEKAKRHAMKMMAEIIKREISAGKNPMGLAGAVLYVSCKNYGEDITQREISEAAGVTEVTIRHDLDSITNMPKTEKN
ncbi:MAG TPA: TFIIB-type zinc ribbon-containing protein [Phototrophicaceae bacterium]|nr:TFIIB-type zinc ribbon-containing protein [Phototrophicaceae bacterium]